MGSPVIWGGNGALNLQTGGLNLTSGQQLRNDGPKNYLANPLAETGTTTGWSLGNVSLTSAFPTGTPTFGSGASGNLTLAATSTTPLSGTYSFSYTSSAATTAGNFIASDAFTVDTADLGKPLTLRFYYQATSNGSNGNWSGTSSNSFGVALYDVTLGSANWIMPAGVWGMTQNSGAGICTATFQTSVTSGQQYRLVVFNANASAGAITVYFDQLFVGPQTSPIGDVTSDWQAYTPTFTGFGTVSAVNFAWRRVGDSMEIAGTFTGGTPTAVVAVVSLPNGASTATTAKIPAIRQCGVFVRDAQNEVMTVLCAANTAGLNFAAASGSSHNLIAANGSAIVGAGESLGFYATSIPIAGWSSNVQMSNDTDTRVVAAAANGSTTAATTSAPFIFTTVNYDTHAAYNSSTGKYTAPVTGKYNVAWSLTANTTFAMFAYVNGSIGPALGAAVGANAIGGGSGLVSLNAGDTVELRPSASVTATNTNANNYVYFNRLSGPAVIAATDSVNARYFASATSISGSLATVVWTTKDFDTTNSMSSGVYTIPVSGKYQVNAFVATTGTFALNNQLVIEIQKNSSVVSREKNYAGGVVTDLTGAINDIISCNAGDTIRIQLSSAATGPSIISSNFENYFSISRVGN